ncbi:hypothetical protein TUM12370_04000 [Salmonella enterica subsp. enterica serovar Choleraesuis]|nr:hypothetical protein TUM12370_04000 [Salmonella enterica subsp. enterica serovar Choleraesuis]
MGVYRHIKGWLANLASSTQLCKKNMRDKSALTLFMLRLGAADYADDAITLNDFAVTT